METTVLTFLNLAAWVAAICASFVVLSRLWIQGELLNRGQRVNVPCRWPALIAVAAWLWLIAGWVI